jgi:hypothetical protein
MQVFSAFSLARAHQIDHNDVIPWEEIFTAATIPITRQM